MISSCTLNIHGVKVPPDLAFSSAAPFRHSLIFLLLCTTLTFLLNLITSGIFQMYTRERKTKFTLACCMDATSVFMSAVWCILAHKFHVRFPGFAVLVTYTAAFLKLEATMAIGYSHMEVTARY